MDVSFPGLYCATENLNALETIGIISVHPRVYDLWPKFENGLPNMSTDILVFITDEQSSISSSSPQTICIYLPYQNTLQQKNDTQVMCILPKVYHIL